MSLEAHIHNIGKEIGRNYRPKQVELIEIINKPLLFHLVVYLYYWQMGFNSVFLGLMECFVYEIKMFLVPLWNVMCIGVICLCTESIRIVSCVGINLCL